METWADLNPSGKSLSLKRIFSFLVRDSISWTVHWNHDFEIALQSNKYYKKILCKIDLLIGYR